jgi:ketosteroid isomerase-like protein
MSMQDTLELIGRYCAAFNRGDRETLLSLLAEDVAAVSAGVSAQTAVVFEVLSWTDGAARHSD